MPQTQQHYVNYDNAEDLFGGYATAIKNSKIQVDALPTPSESNLGKIYQYIGATGTYKNGYFYKCVSDGESTPTYSWEEWITQDTVTFNTDDFDINNNEVKLDTTQRVWTGTKAAWEAVQDKSKYAIINIIDDYSYTDNTYVPQYETMPTASQDYEDNIVQYVGNTITNFTNGYFYKCVKDESNPPVYSWVPQPVQEGGSSTVDAEDVTYSNTLLPNLTNAEEALDLALTCATNSLIQYRVMPTPNENYLNQIVQYKGITNTDFINGYVYKCISDGETPATYSWAQINIQPGLTSVDADDVTYDNTTSGLVATDVQAAIDEIKGSLGAAAAKSVATSITQSNTDLVTAGAVYSYVDQMITQALNGSY